MKIILLIFLVSIVELGTAQQTVGVFQNDSLAFDGYTLLFPNYSKKTWLLDNCGNAVHEWASSYEPGLSAYLLENGDLLRTARIPNDFLKGGSGGRIERHNWEGVLKWHYTYSTADYNQHHDIEPLPNGNILIIAWEKRSASDAIANGRNPDFLDSDEFWSERIIELQPEGDNGGQIVWEWNLWDHLVQDFDSEKLNFGVVADHPELLNINAGGLTVDWIHFNSIDYNPALDQIVLSSRYLNEVMIIDHSTTTAQAATHLGGDSGKGGDILYRWGNPKNYDRGTEADQKLFGQHDAQWIEQGRVDEGKLIVFNNGLNRPEGNYSSIDVWEPPMDTFGNYLIDNLAYGPADLFWTYGELATDALYSPNTSGVERLPNGNTLICEGKPGRITEVTYDGQKVWEYINPIVSAGIVTQGNLVNNNYVFKVRRYAATYPAFNNVELISGNPIELNPTNQDCQIFNDLVSTADNSWLLENIRVINNPIGNQLFIENNTQTVVYFEIINLMGRSILSGKSDNQVITEKTDYFTKGIYLIRFFNKDKNQFFTAKIAKN